MELLKKHHSSFAEQEKHIFNYTIFLLKLTTTYLHAPFNLQFHYRA
jgi:hypothetical protein